MMPQLEITSLDNFFWSITLESERHENFYDLSQLLPDPLHRSHESHFIWGTYWHYSYHD